MKSKELKKYNNKKVTITFEDGAILSGKLVKRPDDSDYFLMVGNGALVVVPPDFVRKIQEENK